MGKSEYKPRTHADIRRGLAEIRRTVADVRRTIRELEQGCREIFMLFDDSKYFLSEAKRHQSRDTFRSSLYARAAVIHSVFALEALLEFLLNPRLTEALISIDYKSFRSLKERLEFVYFRASGSLLATSSANWKAVCRAVELRNKLAHPRADRPMRNISAKDAEDAVMACLGYVGLLSRAGGGKPPDWTTNPNPQLVGVPDERRRTQLIRAAVG